MGELESLVNAVDSGWGLAVVIVVLTYALLFKYGGQILHSLQASNALAQEATAAAQNAQKATEGVAESIITNHGSKNLGDAVDRLTEWMARHMLDAEEDRKKIDKLHKDLELHIAKHTVQLEEHEPLVELGWQLLKERKERRDGEAE